MGAGAAAARSRKRASKPGLAVILRLPKDDPVFIILVVRIVVYFLPFAPHRSAIISSTRCMDLGPKIMLR
jgi:hypothetical protein